MTAFKTFSLITLFLFSIQSFANSGKHFDRVISVIFENANYANAIKQPYFKSLADSGAHFTNFLAQTHPSQGNYMAMTAGSQNGVVNDTIKDVDAKNIVDLLEAKGLTWKAYVESFPGNCFTGKSSGTYARKHNPFISYLDIQKNPVRCRNIVDAAEFDRDAKSGQLPNYVFYVPDLKDDGHDTGVAVANNWYSQKFGPLLSDRSFMDNTIVITTFDESGASPINQIYTSIVGPAVKAGQVATAVNFYSLLNLLEDNWNLGNLGKMDATATPIPNIWK